MLARRLVEAGVRLVTVTWMYIFPGGRVANVWDNHARHRHPRGEDRLRPAPTRRCCIPPLDRGFCALLEDLGAARPARRDAGGGGRASSGGRRRSTRTPGATTGARCQSALLAGGGIRGGQVYGASDRQAAYVKDNPVSPEDLLATMYHALGIDVESEKSTTARAGRIAFAKGSR